MKLLKSNVPKVASLRITSTKRKLPAFYVPVYVAAFILLLSACKKDKEGNTPKDEPFQLQWSKTFGGSKTDMFSSFAATGEGAYVVAATTGSNDGDVTGNHGMNDMWVYKIDRSGNMLWQTAIGGSANDDGSSIVTNPDNTYLVAGNTNSNDGNVSGNHGGQDILLVKLSTGGNILWQKSLGGTGLELIIFRSIVTTSDGGYMLLGNTTSNDGNVSGNHGGMDFWLVKLDGSGNIMWQKTFGGSQDDIAVSIVQTGNAYLLTGQTFSNDGDVSGNHGGGDGWVVKVDASGNKLWQKTYGGTGDDILFLPEGLSDGGYVLSGRTTSPNDGDVKGFHGDQDAWVVKLDASGNVVWQKTLGSTQYDACYCVAQEGDAGFLVAAFTNGNDGDVSGNHGGYDDWFVKLDSNGSIIWQKTYGGAGDDNPTNFLRTVDGRYIFAGQSSSKDGDVKGQHGEMDAWMFTTSER
jgi:hypothetical protein